MRRWPDLSVKVVTFEHRPGVADELLEDLASYRRAYGFDAKVELVAGSLEKLLLQHALDWNADVIILGNSAKHLWLRRLFGDFAMHVIKSASIPLFLSQSSEHD